MAKNETTCGTTCGCEGSWNCKFPNSPAWQRYRENLKKHEEHYESIKPDPRLYSEEGYKRALSSWEMDKAMFEPNKPGYWRANND